jgi:hypothetical protein
MFVRAHVYEDQMQEKGHKLFFCYEHDLLFLYFPLHSCTKLASIQAEAIFSSPNPCLPESSTVIT